MNEINAGIRGTIYVYIELLLSKFITFFIPIILINNLTKAEYGLYSLISSLMIIVGYVTSFGLEDVYIRYIPEYIQKGNLKKVNALFFLGSGIRLLSLLLVLLIMFFSKAEISQLLNAPQIFTDILFFILVFIGLNKLTYLSGDVFMMSYHKRDYVSIIRVVRELLKLLLFAVVVYVLSGGLYGLVIALIVCSLLELMTYSVLVGRRIIHNYISNNDTLTEYSERQYKRLGKFAFFSGLNQMVHGFRDIAVDYLVIAYYMAVEAVASYSVAALFPTLIRSFSPVRMLSGVILPNLVAMYTKYDKDLVIKKAFSFLYKINMFLLFPMTAGILILGSKIIYYIFDPIYSDVVFVMSILVVTLLVSNLADPYYSLSNLLEKQEIIFVSSIWAVYNLVMDIILIPKYGILGAAIATGSAGIFNYIYLWFIYKFVIKIDIKIPLISGAKMLINTGVMTVLVLLLMPFINSVTMICVAVIVGIIAYLVSSYFLKVFSKDERDFINNKINRKWFVF